MKPVPYTAAAKNITNIPPISGVEQSVTNGLSCYCCDAEQCIPNYNLACGGDFTGAFRKFII